MAGTRQEPSAQVSSDTRLYSVVRDPKVPGAIDGMVTTRQGAGSATLPMGQVGTKPLAPEGKGPASWCIAVGRAEALAILLEGLQAQERVSPEGGATRACADGSVWNSHYPLHIAPPPLASLYPVCYSLHRLKGGRRQSPINRGEGCRQAP